MTEADMKALRMLIAMGETTASNLGHRLWGKRLSKPQDHCRPASRVLGLPYREAREAEDEKHVHPLQLDVIERALVLWSNPSETVLTPFMGVGSEVYGAVLNGRRGIGVELKASYYRQAVKNVSAAQIGKRDEEQRGLFEAHEAEVAP